MAIETKENNHVNDESARYFNENKLGFGRKLCLQLLNTKIK